MHLPRTIVINDEPTLMTLIVCLIDDRLTSFEDMDNFYRGFMTLPPNFAWYYFNT